MCVFSLFMPFLSVLFAFLSKNLLLMNLINRYVIFQQQSHCGKQIFDISRLFIQCNTHNCCKHMTGDVNIYSYACVSLLPPHSVIGVSNPLKNIPYFLPSPFLFLAKAPALNQQTVQDPPPFQAISSLYCFFFL